MGTSCVTRATKRSATAYGRNFEQKLINYGVYLKNRAQKPNNIEGIKERLAQPRREISLSEFSEKSFDKFRDSACTAKDEGDVMIDVIPVIQGEQTKHFYARMTQFGNLDPLMAGSPAPPNPDLYYGARPEQLNQNIRDQLRLLNISMGDILDLHKLFGSSGNIQLMKSFRLYISFQYIYQMNSLSILKQMRSNQSYISN